MKIIAIATAASFLIAGAAFAGDQGVGGDAIESNVASGQANNNSSTTFNGLTGAEVEDLTSQAFEQGRETGAAERSDTTQTIRYTGEYDLNSTPAVSAPALTTTLTETCMGSTSIGGAVTGFGLSFGTTWRDSACVRRLDAREMASFGYTLAGKERMCDDMKNREAFARAGTPCYVDLPQAEEEPRAIAPAAPVEEVPALGYASDNNVFDVLNQD